MSETITDYGLQGNVLGELVSDAELEQVSNQSLIKGALQERQNNIQMIFRTGKFSRTELTNLFPDQKTFIKTLKA